MTFSELKQKDVINIADGRKLGRPIDLILNEGACVDALVVPGPSNLWNCLKADRDGMAIPWCRIKRIGDDVILVNIEEGSG